jgi:hypothetical protein
MLAGSTAYHLDRSDIHSVARDNPAGLNIPSVTNIGLKRSGANEMDAEVIGSLTTPQHVVEFLWRTAIVRIRLRSRTG